MKKVCMLFLTLALALSMSLAASADPGNFVSSPSGNQAPVLVEYDNASEDCPAELSVTSYANRDQLPEDAKNALETAYTQISDNKTNLAALNEALLAIAEELGVSVTDLAVSDLFDISRSDCDSHDVHGAFDLALKAETLNNFVCLLHYTNGAWVIVDSAQVTNGEHLEFSVNDFSPFAIVVNTAAMGGDSTDGEDTDAPDSEEPTDDKKGISDYITTGSAAIVAVSAVVLAGAVISYVKFRKQDDYDDFYD